MPTKKEIAALVDEGLKLHREIRPLKKKAERLDEIKAVFRELAGEKDKTFQGSDGAVAVVETKSDTICRVVEEKLLARVCKLAGERIYKLFSLHPNKADEKTFEIHAFKVLPKYAAAALVKALNVPATPWVRFS